MSRARFAEATHRSPGDAAAAARSTFGWVVGFVRKIVSAVAAVAGASVLGALATAAFQIVVSRGLGPAEFGRFASSFALINVVAVGSVSLRNSVAVSTARGPSSIGSARRWSRIDPALVEALVLGAGSAVVVVLISAVTQPRTGPNAGILALVVTVLAYFLLARAQGRLQGASRVHAVLWWSTGSQVVQLGLAATVVVILGGGVTMVLGSVAVAVAASALGASIQSRDIGPVDDRRPFASAGLVVASLTVLVAVLCSIDVVYVNAWLGGGVAGTYAAAATFVKSSQIIPAALTLFLLPRLASGGPSRRPVRMVLIASGLSLFGAGAMVTVIALFGSLVADLVFGGRYPGLPSMLLLFALAWIPWMVVQAQAIQVMAVASRPALVVLVGAVVTQAGLAFAMLPDLAAWFVANGVLGTCAAVTLIAICWRQRNTSVASEIQNS